MRLSRDCGLQSLGDKLAKVFIDEITHLKLQYFICVRPGQKVIGWLLEICLSVAQLQRRMYFLQGWTLYPFETKILAQVHAPLL